MNLASRRFELAARVAQPPPAEAAGNGVGIAAAAAAGFLGTARVAPSRQESGAPAALLDRVELLESVNGSLRRTIARLQGEIAVTRRLAYHDALTGLPNRHLLRDRLEQGVPRALREGRQIALLMLDLDRFKAVNDALGHDAGDQVLREVAWRLQGCTRGSDTVCRYGGDEFIVMLPAVSGREEAESVALKIHACIDAPIEVAGRSVRVGVSVGVAMLRPGDSGIERLIRDADRAMYRVKHAARPRSPGWLRSAVESQSAARAG